MDDEGVDLLAAGQRLLGLLGHRQQVLRAVTVVQRVAGLRLLRDELGRQVRGELVIPVGATQLVVAVGGDHLDLLRRELDNRHVEGAAAEVVDQHGLLGDVTGLREAVRECRRGRLVDDVDHVQTGQLAGQLGGFSLRVAEIRRYGDHHIGDRLAGGALGVSGQRAQDQRRDGRRRVVLAVHAYPPVVVSHMPLDQADDVIGAYPRVPLRLDADHDVGRRVEHHHRGRRRLTVGVRG